MLTKHPKGAGHGKPARDKLCARGMVTLELLILAGEVRGGKGKDGQQKSGQGQGKAFQVEGMAGQMQEVGKGKWSRWCVCVEGRHGSSG